MDQHGKDRMLIRTTVPYRFDGLDGIGTFFFLFNFILYVLCITLICFRFLRFHETFKASFMHPTESLFMPSAVVSLATVLLNTAQYGVLHTGPWLHDTVYIFFWIFVGTAVITSSGIYLLMYPAFPFFVFLRLILCLVGGLLKPSPSLP